MSDLGDHFTTDDGRTALRFRRRLAHPPEKVWRAITESEQLRHWFPCDIVGERHQGARLQLPFWPAHVERFGIDEPVLEGEIRQWEPPRLFEWTWQDDVLRWELSATDDGGTELTFTTVLGDDPYASPSQTAAGYHLCLDHLDALLAGTPRALVDADPAPLEARYAERIR